MSNALEVLINTPPARGSKIVDLVLTERTKIIRAREVGHTWGAIAVALGLPESQSKYLSVVWSRIESRINAKEGGK